MTTIHPSRPSLTTNDSAVLQALFDAESSPSSGVTISPSLPPLPNHLGISPNDYQSIKDRELSIVRTIQDSNVSHEAIKTAIQRLDALITEYTTYPSAYMNRAQALRTLATTASTTTTTKTSSSDPDEHLFTPHNITHVSALFSDLGQAIKLATPPSPADAVSSTQARILADAHTHRGYLLLRLARHRKTSTRGNENDFGGPESLKDVGADQLEEMASRDFFLGGRYGNQVAQQMAVQTNPYAKMCGAIVKEALRKEVQGGN